MTRRKTGKLERGIMKFKPIRDNKNKRFIPYCDFGWHQGIVINYETCEERRCVHYKRLYII